MGCMFLLRIVVNALALWIAAWLLPGMEITARSGPLTGNPTVDLVVAYLFIGFIFGVVNALIRPVVKLLSLPLTILTLGLFTVIINAAMLMLTAWLSSHTPIHLEITTFFWQAILAALIISVVSTLLSAVTGGRR